MLEVRSVEPLEGRAVRLTLTDGSIIERDLADLLAGPIFEFVGANDEAFRRVRVEHGTIAWPNGADIAPETLIWGGPPPHGRGRPPTRLRLRVPT